MLQFPPYLSESGGRGNPGSCAGVEDILGNPRVIFDGVLVRVLDGMQEYEISYFSMLPRIHIIII
jgi:hypothetical protein